MPAQAYDTVQARIDKLAGAILARAIPEEVLGITGNMHKMP